MLLQSSISSQPPLQCIHRHQYSRNVSPLSMEFLKFRHGKFPFQIFGTELAMEPSTSSVIGRGSRTRFNPCLTPNPSIYLPCSRLRVKMKANTAMTGTKTWKISAVAAPSACLPCNQTDCGQLLAKSQKFLDNEENRKNKKRVFFLDVNPLCYAGSTPSLHSFAHWISLFFSEVSHNNPVIAVIDGERGNEYRRQLLPSYKAHRRKFSRYVSDSQKISRGSVERSHLVIIDVLKKCNVPVVKVEDHEADDVVATLVGEVLQRGYLVVIASPDKDFKQLISENVQIVMPIPEFNRWSFYTLKHYVAQYSCDPCSDLSLRCMIGDEVDGVPGIQHVAPGFGRKTAVKLLKKHGSLDNLLNAAAVRTVGKQYAQDALIKYADFLRRNYEVLALKRDVDVHLQEEWLSYRDTHNDSVVLSNFLKLLGDTQKLHHQAKSYSPNG